MTCLRTGTLSAGYSERSFLDASRSSRPAPYIDTTSPLPHQHCLRRFLAHSKMTWPQDESVGCPLGESQDVRFFCDPLTTRIPGLYTVGKTLLVVNKQQRCQCTQELNPFSVAYRLGHRMFTNTRPFST